MTERTGEEKQSLNVLFVAASTGHVEAIRRLLEPAGHFVETAPDAQGALDRLASGGFDAVLATLPPEWSVVEQRLRHAQKMEAVGHLVGSVAHDFNNVLTAVAGYSDLLLALLDGPSKRYAAEIRKAADRAAALTRRLLAFSRSEPEALHPIDLNDVVAGMEGMLRRLMGEDVSLEIARAPSLGRVLADPGQIEQVLLNLVLNARDAMPRGGGRVTIETRDARDGEAPHYAMLAVTDTGAGMSEAVRARLFEPFFTTKEPSKGTGLGLATVAAILRKIDGRIAVTSSPGLGSRFEMRLPCAAGEARRAPAEAPGATRAEVRLRSETVLVAEDDDDVRRLVADVLRKDGYHVLEAKDGGEALRICEEHRGPIDAIVADSIMPGLRGRALVERLDALRPGLRVLFISGHAGASGEIEPGAAFLPKPFAPDELARRVRELLDAKPRRAS